MVLRRVTGIAVCVFLASSQLVAGGQSSTAQPPKRLEAPSRPTRAFVSLGGGLQSIATTTFGEADSADLYVEQFTWDARYKLKNAVAFEAGVGVRVRRSLLAAVTYSRSQHR
jgi:hypothetical protein